MAETSFPLKIVYLIGQLGLGGSERQLALLLKHMDKERFELHVVVFNPSPNYTLDDDLRRAGVQVYLVPQDCKGIVCRVVWLIRLFLLLKPVFVHSWSFHDNPYAAVAGLLAGVPYRLGSVRDAIRPIEFCQFPPLFRWMMLHGVQGHMVNSLPIKDDLCSLGVPARKVFVLSNCVQTESISDSSGQLPPWALSGRLVGMVANLRRKKNHIVFVRALARLMPEFPDMIGIMVGQPVRVSDPELPEMLQSEINLLGVSDRILMAGFHPNPPEFLRHFEIFCLPSEFEGTPNVVLEAMAAGLPVVATRVGGIPQVVEHGVTGLLISPGDGDALVDALRQLLVDPVRARAMGQAGHARVTQEFSCQAILPKFEAYYISQLSGHRSSKNV